MEEEKEMVKKLRSMFFRVCIANRRRTLSMAFYFVICINARNGFLKDVFFMKKSAINFSFRSIWRILCEFS